MYEFLLPVIKFSTDVTAEPHIYLCEDALDLWLAMLHSAPSITSDVLSLYQNVPSLLGKYYVCLRITELYSFTNYWFLMWHQDVSVFSILLHSVLLCAYILLLNFDVSVVFLFSVIWDTYCDTVYHWISLPLSLFILQPLPLFLSVSQAYPSLFQMYLMMIYFLPKTLRLNNDWDAVKAIEQNITTLLWPKFG